MRQKFSLQTECTLDEVAEELQVSKQGVLAIEKRALAKVRQGLVEKGFSESLFLDYLRDLDQCRKI